MNAPALAQGVFLERLALALCLGLAIGLERQWRQRSAGLHTATLVAVGAALFTTMPELAGSTDLRVAAQIVTGVGFLAGGVILREGLNVRGLVTAATLWATAAVGVLAGAGFAREALVGAAVIVLTNLAALPLSEIISRIPRAAGEMLVTTYTLHVGCEERARPAVRDRILREVHSTSLTLNSMSNSAPSHGAIAIVAEIARPGGDNGIADRLCADILRLDGVTSATWDGDERTI